MKDTFCLVISAYRLSTAALFIILWQMSNTLNLSNNQFDSNGYWSVPLQTADCPSADSVSLFDQNGYDLTDLEILYSDVNKGWHSIHRNTMHVALKQQWFTQQETIEGPVLNHSLLFERKGYNGLALEQLTLWANKNPLIWKVAKYRPKWGLDFSLDFVSRSGDVFEILHYEFDGFNYDEIQNRKEFLDKHLLSIDWQDAAVCLLRLKDKWFNLDFFAQSLWKCTYFGVGPERFKMVAWA